MAKQDTICTEIYLMAPIFDDSAMEFCKTLDLVPKDEDITVLLNSPGGSVFAGWTMIGRMKERTGKNNAKVYGHAASMSMFFLLYMDDVEALDVTKFLVHRASGYVENEDDQRFLDDVNKDLRQVMETKLNLENFTKITGLTMDDVFKGDKVKDVWLTAKEAKKIGLINDVIRIKPEEMKAFNEKFVAFVKPEQGSDGTKGIVIKQADEFNNNNKKKIIMNREELQVQNPVLYNALLADGEKIGFDKGVKAEKERVENYLAFLEVDKDTVITSIKEGKSWSVSIQNEMLIKMQAGQKADNLNKDSAKNAATNEADEKTDTQKLVEKTEKELEAGRKEFVKNYKF